MCSQPVFSSPSCLYTSLYAQTCFPSSAPLFVALPSPLDTNGYLPFPSHPLTSTVPSAPSSATGIKLVHFFPALLGPLLACELPQPDPRCRQTPDSPTPLPLNIPCFPLLAPCPFPGVHGSLSSSAAIRKWARSHGWVSKPLGKSWIL